MASSLVVSTAVLSIFIYAVLSVPPIENDDTWMAMLMYGNNTQWCPSVIVTSKWMLTDQACAVSEIMNMTAVAGVRVWSDLKNGQVREVNAMLKTPFGLLRGVRVVVPFEFNENVSFIRLADTDLPQYGLACRASGASRAGPGQEQRLVSQTVLALPADLCPAFGVVLVQMCVRSYPWFFPCSALPVVFVSCHGLLIGWCDHCKTCTGYYQTHLGQSLYQHVTWLAKQMDNSTLVTGQLVISSQAANPAVLFLPLLVPLSYLLTAMSSPRTA